MFELGMYHLNGKNFILNDAEQLDEHWCKCLWGVKSFYVLCLVRSLKAKPERDLTVKFHWSLAQCHLWALYFTVIPWKPVSIHLIIACLLPSC